ncbi:hypothetical protein TRICI_004222 [Trichomonascus ciferrii]|uniref:Major facilitator superfamily (MFS) profile domain-containing protein n=1 Tax=Trichomonascus ciferrii TaxID=44093 RepID=A0A642V1K6_9ASCO|nr:hypothetical protein TRICI_004222 [Trichomonascus ciferrii]
MNDKAYSRHNENYVDKEKGCMADAKMASTVDAAAGQIEAEHELTFTEGVRQYPWAVIWSVIVSLTVVMDGYDNTLVNSFFGFPQFVDKFGTVVNGEKVITASWQMGLSSIICVGNIIGVLFSGQLSDNFGHIWVMLGAMVFLIGTIFMFFFAPNVEVLFAACLVSGIPVGIFSAIAPAYASEVCPVVLRAYLTTYINACWIIGQLSSQGVLRGCLPIPNHWSFRIPFAIQWAWPIPISVLVFLAPDSPWWHVRHGRLDKARKMVRRLVNKDMEETQVDRIVGMMIHTNELERKEQGNSTYLDCFRGVDLCRTEISCITFICQPASMGNIMAYSAYFFQLAGLPADQSFNLSIGQYCIGLVGTVLSWILIAHAGRRTIYIIGLFSVGFLYLIMGFIGLAPESNTAAPWAVAGMLLFIIFVYDLSVGPVCFSLVSEMSSTRLRTKTISLARGTFQVWSVINGVIYPQMLNETAGNWKGKIGFFQFGICTICGLWAYFRLPEPKGRTYEEMDIMFMNSLPARKFSSYTVVVDQETSPSAN